ncbi:MAG: ABC transporter permease subunit [Phycisphaerae bacterium]|nr:ABC transporter permease subunit [Phycisphaerae bacterium]
MTYRVAVILILILATSLNTFSQSSDTIVVGSKNFTEQDILGELVAQLIEEHTDLTVERRFGLGGTGICHAALLAGELDIYVEYTGTALLDVLKLPLINHPDEVFAEIASAYREQFDVQWLPPIGFNNTYAIAVREDDADEQGWTRVSDLVTAAPKLSAGFTSEFVVRPDGYPGLRRSYGMNFGTTMDMDPGLMYSAVADGQVDVICAFATDGRIAGYGLHLLEDDRAFFPPYDAAPVVRGETVRAHPELRAALAPLAGTISDKLMQRMNYAVDETKLSPASVAAEWIKARATRAAPTIAANNAETPAAGNGVMRFLASKRKQLLSKTIEHIQLTAIAMLIAIAVGVPIGIGIQRLKSARGPVLTAAEIMQTIPSLAMLAFLFAVYGLLGPVPAITALVLYALLPIILNTYTGLNEVSPALIEAANGLGMSGRQKLIMVELPLAMPVMMAGIRTATVWTVGIATLSTYIGAGGLGDFISRGMARNDARLTLLGAVPAAMMAVVLSMLIRRVERRLTK